jgi:hypothetical protein
VGKKKGAMNRAPTGFGKGKIEKRKKERKEKERGHGVPCPYEEKTEGGALRSSG